MPTVKAKVLPQAPRGAGTVLSAETAPLLRGNGDITYVCGSCGTPLVENIAEGQISRFAAICPKCAAANEVG